MKWIALFSQTGSEIKALSEYTGKYPDLIFTNNPNREQWVDNHPHAFRMKHDLIMDYLNTLENKDVLITLHGYLRIIPSDICEKFEIVNGHPGLITEYPELKGKDPQERITEEMDWIGSVCHKVTAGVDEGPVLTQSMVKNTGGDYYNVLKETSLKAWRQYFVERN